MAQLKTQPNKKSVEDFLNGVENDTKRQDSFTILEMMKAATGEEPIMWGDSIVGFGTYRYKYASGKAAEWFLTGFSPRKANLVIYTMPGYDDQTELTASKALTEPHRKGVGLAETDS